MSAALSALTITGMTTTAVPRISTQQLTRRRIHDIGDHSHWTMWVGKASDLGWPAGRWYRQLTFVNGLSAEITITYECEAWDQDGALRYVDYRSATPGVGGNHFTVRIFND